MTSVATPFAPTFFGDPICVPLAKNVTVPVGEPVLTIVAVRVTGAVMLIVVEAHALPVLAERVVRVKREVT